MRPLRHLLALTAAPVVALTGMAAVPIVDAGASPAPQAVGRACGHASAPYAVGTTTITVRSRGSALRTTVAYPALSNGANATPVCKAVPLVVAGHGSEGDGASAAQLHQYLVAHGYVVAAPTFAVGFDFAGYTKDVSRTITVVRKASRADRGVLSGRIKDGSKVGYIGTSMGGMIGLSLVDRAGRDKRINAVVSKAGTTISGSFAGAGGPPLLMINGNADTVVPYSAARASYRGAKRPKGFITLDGVGHDLNTAGDPILTAASTGFLDRYLRGRKAGIKELKAAVARSDIATLRKRW